MLPLKMVNHEQWYFETPVMTGQLQTIVENAGQARDQISGQTQGEIRDAVEQAMALLDGGSVRVAEKVGSN